MSIPAGIYDIDASHSELGFSVRHAGIAKVRGRFTGVEGEITVADDFPTSAVSVTIDAGSIDTGNSQRDEHLASAEFWNVEANPQWSFTSASIEGSGEEFTLNGDLSINGITKPVALNVEYGGAATDAFGNDRLGFSVETEISRKDFGLTWNVALEGGGFLVSDNVKVSLEISAIKRS